MNKLLLLLVLPLLTFSQSYELKVDDLFEQKKFNQAEKIVLEYVIENPNSLKAIELLGDTFGYQEKWDGAIEQYKKLVDARSGDANYQYKYGGALGMKALTVNKLRALPLVSDAKAAFIKASILDSTHVEVRWALVKLYMQLPGIIGGSKKKSLFYAQELEELSAVDGFLAKAFIYDYDNKIQIAESYFKSAVAVGGSLHCYNQLINFYISKNEYLKAILTIEDAYKKHHKNELMYHLGELSARYTIELDKGEYYLNNFIYNHSQSQTAIEWAYLRLAQIQRKKNNKKEAINYIEKALLIRSDFKEAIEERTKILLL